MMNFDKSYKILGAIYSLDVFTINEVANFSGVKLNTVHTFFQRNKDLFEIVGKIKTNRRGGSPTQYRLKENLHKELKKQLTDLYEGIVPARKPKSYREPYSLNLRIAREAINNLHLESRKEKRKEMLDLAERNLKSAIIEKNSDEIYRPYFNACVDFEKGKLNFLKAREIIDSKSVTSINVDEIGWTLKKANGYFNASAQFFFDNELRNKFSEVRSFVFSKYNEIIPKHKELGNLPKWLNLLENVKSSFENKLFPEIYDDIELFLNIKDLKLPIRLIDGVFKRPDYLTRSVKNSITNIGNKYNVGHMLSIRTLVNVSEPDVVLEKINKASEKIKKPIVVILTIDSEDKETTSKLIEKLRSFEHKRISSIVLDSNFNNSVRAKVYSSGSQYVGKANILPGEIKQSIFKSRIERTLNRYRLFNRSSFRFRS